jgi:hypothetical protein
MQLIPGRRFAGFKGLLNSPTSLCHHGRSSSDIWGIFQLPHQRCGFISNASPKAKYICDRLTAPLLEIIMEVKLLIGAHAYAHIQYAGGSMDVLLDAGHSPEFSLSRTASELQDKAKAIIRRAEIIQQAAAYL